MDAATRATCAARTASRTHAADLCAVAEAIGEPVVLAGHSMGAFVAVHAAHDRPDLFTAVVLVDGGVALPFPDGADPDEVLDQTLGPAIERLGRTYPSVDAYVDVFRQHPAMAPTWDDAMEAYARYDSLETADDRMGVVRPVRLLRSREHNVPVALGTVRPSIVIPSIADTWSDDRRTAVMLHELAHVARYDCLTHTLAVAACAMYWFHPGVWWVARRLRVERELACDDRVIAAGTEPRDYAGHLLEIAYRSAATGRRRWPSAWRARVSSKGACSRRSMPRVTGACRRSASVSRAERSRSDCSRSSPARDRPLRRPPPLRRRARLRTSSGRP